MVVSWEKRAFFLKVGSPRPEAPRSSAARKLITDTCGGFRIHQRIQFMRAHLLLGGFSGSLCTSTPQRRSSRSFGAHARNQREVTQSKTKISLPQSLRHFTDARASCRVVGLNRSFTNIGSHGSRGGAESTPTIKMPSQTPFGIVPESRRIRPLLFQIRSLVRS